ncbi:microphthalmia-associated transcription factor-like [Ahaetulla prasina]|uniref:microphthalmia-associated transcription factor-like n=1 Tax=Ahaetulla prasina TaxID=499056 RepID=UPI0026472873|nr:microphthalmia-associated transcription factor-like [Ahaetulla prasina]
MQAESGIVPDFEVGEEFHEEPKIYYELKSQPLKNSSLEHPGASKPPLSSSNMTSRILLRQQLMREQMQEQERREQRQKQQAAQFIQQRGAVSQTPAINVSLPASLSPATQVPMEVLKVGDWVGSDLRSCLEHPGASKPPLSSSNMTSRILLRQQLMREQMQEQERREQRQKQQAAQFIQQRGAVSQTPAINVSLPASLSPATQVPMEVLKPHAMIPSQSLTLSTPANIY